MKHKLFRALICVLVTCSLSLPTLSVDAVQDLKQSMPTPSAEMQQSALIEDNLTKTEAAPTESLTYELEGDTYTVTGIGDETVVVIPETYRGIPVTAIRGHHGTGAFARKNITSVTIPDSITEIGQNTFNNCSMLKEVLISENSSLSFIGNNAFSGNSSLKSIYIPKGVTRIGDSAFNNCGALDNITVAEENTVYSSVGNCLIEKATGVLIRGTNATAIPGSVTSIAQAAFRRSSITDITIPVSVTSIENYVFQSTPVASINYEGTVRQWNSITKSKLWNMGIDLAKIYCTDGILNSDGTEFKPPVTKGKTLIVYFSWSSNTERMANTIKEQTGGDLLELIPVTAYPTDYTACTEVALAERDRNVRPAIQNLPESIDEYDTILIGYPIWWHTAPMIIGTFLENYDLTGIDVYPFTQSASMNVEQFENSMEFVRSCANGATVHDGLFARYSDINSISSYLSSNDLLNKDNDPDDTEKSLGDINKDGSVNAKDSNLMKRILLGRHEPNDSEYTAADIDRDGSITTKDSFLLKKIIIA